MQAVAELSFRLRRLLRIVMPEALRSLFRRLPISDRRRRDLAFFIFRMSGERLRHLPAYRRYLREEKWPKAQAPADLPGYRNRVIAQYFSTGQGPAMIMISHRQGGGTRQHVDGLTVRLEAEGWRVFDLQRHDDAHLRLITPDYARGEPLYFRWPEEEAALADCFTALGATHLHLHHSVDFPDDFRLRFPAIAAAAKISYDFTVHDYFSICPRFTLFDEAVRGYCGEPEDVRKCSACVKHQGWAGGRLSPVDVAAWRREYAGLLAGARQVFVPDVDAAVRLKRYFPDVIFTLRPHPEPARPFIPAAAIRKEGEALRVLILGGIAPHKGSKVLLDCAADALQRGLPMHFTLIGHSDIDAPLKALRNVTVSGHFLPETLTERLREGKFHLAFLPSVIPETYNYALSECWRHGLFPVCLDIGAIAGRIRAAGLGAVLPYDHYYQPAQINDALLAMKIAEIEPVTVNSVLADYPSLTRDYYGLESV